MFYYPYKPITYYQIQVKITIIIPSNNKYLSQGYTPMCTALLPWVVRVLIGLIAPVAPARNCSHGYGRAHSRAAARDRHSRSPVVGPAYSQTSRILFPSSLLYNIIHIQPYTQPLL